jgi:hypothetical protein
MKSEAILSEDIDRRSGRRWSRTARLIFSLSIGTAITLLAFWVMITNKAPWQFNYALMPGAIVALIVGFIAHYDDPWYALTLIGVNSTIYGSLVYVLVSTIGFKRRTRGTGRGRLLA